MRTESWPVRQEAYLWPCPACGTRNGMNARQCWRCEGPMPRPSADALLAAWDALAPGPRRSTVAVLPSVAVACAMVSRATVFAAHRDVAKADAPSVGEAHRDVVDDGRWPPGGERFGAVARDASSVRRSVRLAAVALAFVGLVIAGYPVYRGAERLAATPEVRRAPFVPTAVHRADAAPAMQSHAVAAETQQPRPVAAARQEPRPVAAPVTRISVSSQPIDALPFRAPSPAQRHAAHAVQAAHPTHAAHAAHAGAHGVRTASARRVAPRSPMLVAGEVSLHDAALGR